MVACALALTGCSSLEGAGDKGYVSGNGAVTELSAGDREGPISLSGDGLDGGTIDLADYRGKVVVINVWGAWCTECREEAPDLVEVANASDPDEVAFLGIDVRDPSRDNAQRYEKTFKIPYPSLYDPSGATLLEFHGTLTPNAVPSTIVLDRKGRVAASILGVLPSKTTLSNVIDKVVDDG